MIDKLKSFLQGAPDETDDRPDDLQIAVVALLIRAATTDAEFGEEERAAIRRIALQSFSLEEDELDQLIGEAENAETETMDLHRWVQTIKRAYDEEERIGLIEKMWEVVYADGVLDDYEANLLRRVAGLIYVPDRASGQARQRVLARLGLS
ncbi:putative tellurite resistance protein B-like protein [Parvibaculum indicum]|uniref:tellurite resistance TerB family protein n=1 Tax=Parvibaculum indicum TaxID=562969 RepID=UPI0014212117|nr:TerB family tellurite resistance protein [Parvibaculum indicum]NIJ42331.1 putative tellurite resistance protein B-like protein [Parvibaculum indicum]